jgi:hypothetical protein
VSASDDNGYHSTIIPLSLTRDIRSSSGETGHKAFEHLDALFEPACGEHR